MRRVAILALAFLMLAVPASAARAPLTASRDWWPVWSPNDKNIAFTRINGTGHVFQLFIYRVATRRSILIGTSSSQLTPTWSADGARLAYASGGRLYVVHSDGFQKHRYVTPMKAYAPAWGHGGQLAYLVNGNLWVGGEQWAADAQSQPSWNGDQLAFATTNGIYVGTTRENVHRVAAVNEPGAPVWSPSGDAIAYIAGNAIWIVTPGSAPVQVSPQRTNLAGTPPSWSRSGTSVAYTGGGHLWASSRSGVTSRLAPTVGAGASYAHLSDQIAFSGSHPGCPGHASIRVYESSAAQPSLTGGCGIAGTTGADVIYGTSAGGDMIAAGAGNDTVHANNRHHDTVSCGPGRDTVYADRTDRLLGCELVHR